MIDIVVARYRENLDWLKNLSIVNGANIIVYNKGIKDYDFDPKWQVIDLPNLGQCWGSFMTYLTSYYERLPSTTIFLTGCCMSTQEKRFITHQVLQDIFIFKKTNSTSLRKEYNIESFEMKHWESSTTVNRFGSYYSPSEFKNLGHWWKKYFPHKKLYSFVNFRSIFAVSKDQVLKIPLDSYKLLLTSLRRSPLQEEAHFLERSSTSIWFEKEINQRKQLVILRYSLGLTFFVLVVYLFVWRKKVSSAL
jgi:hypothetical protein